MTTVSDGYFWHGSHLESFDIPERETEVQRSWIAIGCTISTIAAAFIFIPPIAIGFKWGLFSYSLSYIHALGFFKNYQEESSFNPSTLNTGRRNQSLRKFNWTERFFAGPILEEVIFRGFLQQSVQTVFVLTGKVSFPAAFSFANVLTAAVFGACHFRNDETSLQSFFHVSRTFISGIIQGVAMLEGGLVAACIAHIVHNTCAEPLHLR